MHTKPARSRDRRPRAGLVPAPAEPHQLELLDPVAGGETKLPVGPLDRIADQGDPADDDAVDVELVDDESARPLRGELVADPHPVELSGMVAGWLLGYGSAQTRRAYARDLATWARWCEHLHVDPRDAGRVHVDAFARHLTEALQLAPATIARRLAAVSAFYRWCVLEHHLPDNPAVHVRRPSLDPDTSTTIGLTGAHARALLAAAGEHSTRMRALVALLLVDGLRISEALALDVDDVQGHDRGHRIATLRRKGGRTAHVALPPLVADAVDTYLTGRTPRPTTGRGSTPMGEPLFVTGSGARWRPGNAARALTALAARAGIPDARRVTPHALRHAAITLALDAGVPLHEVQDFAGHRDPRSTRRYDRARGRLDRHASYTLASQLV